MTRLQLRELGGHVHALGSRRGKGTKKQEAGRDHDCCEHTRQAARRCQTRRIRNGETTLRAKSSRNGANARARAKRMLKKWRRTSVSFQIRSRQMCSINRFQGARRSLLRPAAKKLEACATHPHARPWRGERTRRREGSACGRRERGCDVCVAPPCVRVTYGEGMGLHLYSYAPR